MVAGRQTLAGSRARFRHLRSPWHPMTFDSKRVLVTGGAGFIGSALVWELNQRGCDRIVVVDRLGETEKWRNLAPLRFEDYLEAEDLAEALEGRKLGEFDLVLHLGACSSTTETDATYFIRNNYEYTKTLAGWALGRGVRFVYASSAATYGRGDRGMSDRDDSPAALARLRPLNMYGYSKHLFDLWAARQGLLGRITGIKYFNIFGPNEAHKGDMRSVVAKAVPQVLGTGSLRLFRSHDPAYADGEQLRDFLYVKDAVRMTLHLADRDAAVGLFNVGSGRATTWLDVADAVFTALGRERSIEFIDMPEHLRPKYQYFTRADLTRLREAGYEAATTPLGEAIAEYVREYILPDQRLGDEAAAS
jgi:ADP-L-glycero-D-manno-heptose 6-epimerase